MSPPCAFSGSSAVLAIVAVAAAMPAMASTDDIVLDTAEAEAALAILQRLDAREPVDDALWARLFASDGYVRLKAREASMKRDFTDDDFRAFLRQPATVERTARLARTLEAWRRADLAGAVRRVRAYLPAGATIRTRIYPVIKPKPNSFVFSGDGGVPAIFLFLDPDLPAVRFENTVAHELHHIGMTCIDGLDGALVDLARFNEGLAMLAAAGGPDVHPHAASTPEDRARWDRDVARAKDDVAQVAAYLAQVAEGTLTGEARQSAAFAFYGEQGPWYTVGYVMASAIERAFGRARLIECFCDTRLLLPSYEAAAEKLGDPALPRWPAGLVAKLRGP